LIKNYKQGIISRDVVVISTGNRKKVAISLVFDQSSPNLVGILLL